MKRIGFTSYFTSMNEDETDFISMHEGEIEAMACCGCKLDYDEDGCARFFMCRVHEAGPDLLRTCEDVLEWLKTGKVDGVGFDEPQVIEVLETEILKSRRRSDGPIDNRR